MELRYGELIEELTGPGSHFEIAEEPTTEQRPIRHWKHAPSSLRAVLETSRSFADRPFLRLDDMVMTYGEHADYATAFAVTLVDVLEITPGDRVAIAMRNLPEWSVAFFGAAAAGAIVVSLNAWWTVGELLYAISDSTPSVIVADAERWDQLASVVEDLRSLGVRRVFVVGEPKSHHSMDTGFVESFDRCVTKTQSSLELPYLAEPLGPNSDATIFYTSGTTSRPKGVLGTHGNICSNMMTRHFARSVRLSAASGSFKADKEPDVGGDIYLLTAPLFHAMGCHSALLGTIACGGTLLLMHRWNVERALELMESHRVTTFGGAPTMIRHLLDMLAERNVDLSSLRELLIGGAPLSPALVAQTRRALPNVVLENGYGMTEASSTISFIAGEECVAFPESVGRVIPVCDAIVVSADGDPLPSDAAGELWIRGPGVTRGYWQQPAATEAVFGGGWLKTGDIARLDDAGRIYLVDRAKDVIIRGGENISSVEVESRLLEHPSIADAAVIAVPDATMGECVGAIIVTRTGMHVTEDELREFLAERLARFKIPGRYWFWSDELPRGHSGKILKRSLREELGLLDVVTENGPV